MNPLLAALLHLLCPVACPVCGRLGEVLCPTCRDAILSPAPPRCLLCGLALPCLQHPDGPRVHPASLYKGRIPDVIWALKTLGLRALGPRLGEGMARLWDPPEGLDLLLPVPLHPGSARGYNQAFDLAKGMSRAWGVPALDAARWARKAPRRVGLTRELRMDLDPEDFRLPDLTGISLALVDDVCTTGTTLSRLALACEGAGAVVLAAFTLSTVEMGRTGEGVV